jgi:hypothetical protein
VYLLTMTSFINFMLKTEDFIIRTYGTAPVGFDIGVMECLVSSNYKLYLRQITISQFTSRPVSFKV